jgi:WD40 repeat protein
LQQTELPVGLGIHFRANSDIVSCAVFSHGGDRIASVSSDNSIGIWDVRNAKLLCRFKGHQDWVSSIAFPRTGDVFASGSADCTIRIWKMGAERELQCLDGFDSEVTNVAFSSNGRLVVGRSFEGMVRIWELPAGRLVHGVRTTRGYLDLESLSDTIQQDTHFALSDGVQTEVRSATTFEPVAWIATPLSLLTNPKSGRVWMGAEGRLVEAFELSIAVNDGRSRRLGRVVSHATSQLILSWRLQLGL